MEYMIFAMFALGVIIIIMAAGWFQEKKNEKKFIHRLRTEYGTLPKREYQAEQFKNISHYFEKHKDGFYLDDITWNDLEMDEIFRQMNHTYSSAGEEYLYYVLRTPLNRPEELVKREEVITYFREHAEQRVTWQFLFAKFGRTGKYSIMDYLGYLDELGARSNLRHYLSIAAFFLAIPAVAISPAMGITLMFVIMVYNLVTYFKIKKSIEPYIISFIYIFRLLNGIKGMEKNVVPVLANELTEMRRCREAFQKFRRGSYILMSSARMTASGNPLEVIMDYLRMGFHLDLIKFNQMLAQVRKHTAEIDRIITIAGSIEAMIAIGAWREGLLRDEEKGMAIPEFLTSAELDITGLYHPLLAHPVKNDISVQNSVLLTGSNASGKSTFLKTVALNAILAQTVHTCAAVRYRAGMFQIASSMSLRDNILEGDSYYMAEIKAMKRLTDMRGDNEEHILVFVDEVLRGTNTVERIAASTQILRSLNRGNSLCFAATHDIELTHLLESEYENYHFEEAFQDGDIYFPYQLMKGRATTRNAIRLLQAMGYDPLLVHDAEELAKRFMESGGWGYQLEFKKGQLIE